MRDRHYSGDTEAGVQCCGWREWQSVGDLKGAAMAARESLRVSVGKCKAPGYIQRVYSRGAHFAWTALFWR